MRMAKRLTKFEVTDSLFVTLFGRPAKFSKRSQHRLYSGDGGFDRIKLGLAHMRAIRWPH